MKTYRVIWEIDIEANCPEDAVSLAREMQLDSNSGATVFCVAERGSSTLDLSQWAVIDLEDLDGTARKADEAETALKAEGVL